MVAHLQSRVTPWHQYASHVQVRGTSLKMDVWLFFKEKLRDATTTESTPKENITTVPCE